MGHFLNISLNKKYYFKNQKKKRRNINYNNILLFISESKIMLLEPVTLLLYSGAELLFSG